jgi:hypothetical protein
MSDMDSIVDRFVYEMLREECRDKPEDEIVRISEEYAKHLLKELYPIIEDVRSTNEDMRAAAEKEIAELLTEIDRISHENT